MSKIILVADSTCDLGPELIKAYDVRVIPMHINMELDGEMKSFTDVGWLPEAERPAGDGYMISEEMIQICEAKGIIPTTAALNFAEFVEAFTPLVADGETHVICVTISSELSLTHSAAIMAKSEVPNGQNIHVIDSRTLSAGSALLLRKAHYMRDAGKSAPEIAAKLEELKMNGKVSFLLESTEWLRKGGRISGFKQLMANMLNIKPCIEVDAVTGKMGPGKKYKGQFGKALTEYVETKLAGSYDDECIFITHAGTKQETIDMVKAKVQEIANFKEIHVTRAGMTISCHCGRDTLGILFLSK